jgi:hypothetical protein
MIRKLISILALSLATFVFAHAQTSVTGKWEAQTKDGKVVLDLKADGKIVTGTYTIAGTVFPVEAGKIVDSKTLSFEWTTAFPPAGNPVRRTATAKLNGDNMKLEINVEILSTGAKSKETMTFMRAK